MHKKPDHKMATNLLTPISSLNMSDSTLYDFVVNHPGGAHVKDTKTGAYLILNQHALNVLGKEKQEDIIDFSIHDIDKFMRPYWGDRYAKEISEMDQKAITTGVATSKSNSIVLNARNEIYIQDMLKLPLMGRNRKVIAIMSISTDLTRKVDLFYLLDLYLHMHATQSIAVTNFMKYLGISSFFQEELTYKELICLLHMRIDSAYKILAKKLDISVKTVETHVSHIINKLKVPQLSAVLTYLRVRSQKIT